MRRIYFFLLINLILSSIYASLLDTSVFGDPYKDAIGFLFGYIGYLLGFLIPLILLSSILPSLTYLYFILLKKPINDNLIFYTGIACSLALGGAAIYGVFLQIRYGLV